METIIVKPKTEKELFFLKDLFKHLSVEYKEQKKTYITDNLDDFWSEVRNHKETPAKISIEELRVEVLEATEDLKKGNGIRHQDLINEMKTWI